jgi:Transposase DDE domain.
MSDHKGARLILEALPSGSTLIADRGYDSNWFREALADKNITSCIPPTKSRKAPIAYDKTLYRHRIATRYDRCAHTFFSAICIAAAVAFYLN